MPAGRPHPVRRGVRVLLAVLPALALGGGSARAASATTPQRNVTIALRPRDPAALAAYARAVSTPGSPDFHHYLTPRAFAARFGASARELTAVRASLRAAGQPGGTPSTGHLSLAIDAGPGALRRAHLTTLGPARASRAVRAAVSSVVGLNGGDGGRPLAVRSPPAAPRSMPPVRVGRLGAGAATCTTAATDAAATGGFTDPELAAAYGFTPLYAAGDDGAGTTIAVYELEPHDPSDIAAFQRCMGTHTVVSDVDVDGGAGRGAGSDEAALDIENLVGFAPGARLLVYQGPNSSSGLPGSGPYDVYSAIVNQDRAQVVSVSWGQCEAQLGDAAARDEATLFEQAAVEGQTIVAAAGDDGSEDCDTAGPRSSRATAVDDPAGDPWVTGVGGTTVSSLDPLTQTAWNGSGGAGGGGFSSLWPLPGYQASAPAWLHVRRSGPACRLRAGCREVPDVSADADPTTGYEVYWNGADSQPQPSGWQELGGTSAAAPVWAALFALADADGSCAGARIGDAGPALYHAAATAYAADFHDVTNGETDLTGTHPGDWTAGAGYDLATGLGTPDAAPLAASLCADTSRLR